MFKKEHVSRKEAVLSLFQKDEDCFEYFKEQCRQKGINIAAVFSETKAQSIFKDIPYMCIFVTSEKEYNEYETDFGTREMVSNRVKEAILPAWYETCKVFQLNVDDYYHPRMPIGLSRIDFTYYSYFSREYKQEIKDIITKEAGCEPKYVFASSSGYIAVIFSEEQYINIEKLTAKITENILIYENAIRKELLGDVSLPPLSVHIYHLGMDINLYGLSRED